MDFITLIGTAGATLILLAFTLNQLKKCSTESLQYNLLNLAGSFLMVVYSILLGSIPFLVLNSVWLLVSVRGLVDVLRRKSHE